MVIKRVREDALAIANRKRAQQGRRKVTRMAPSFAERLNRQVAQWIEREASDWQQKGATLR